VDTASPNPQNIYFCAIEGTLVFKSQKMRIEAIKLRISKSQIAILARVYDGVWPNLTRWRI
jgi:hypothetical protein